MQPHSVAEASMVMRRSMVIAAASLVLCALASTWGVQGIKRAELAEAREHSVVSSRLLEQVELARAEERVIGIKSELADADQNNRPAPPANLGGNGDLAQIERQLAAVKVLSGRVAADEAEAGRARAAEAQLKAAVQSEIRKRRSEIDKTWKQPRVSEMEKKAERATIRTWRAEQAKAWMKVETASRLSRLARMQKTDLPEIKKWTEEQSAAWKKARKSTVDEDTINQALKHEASQIKLWRDQQEHATRKWREHASEKAKDAEVRRAQKTEHVLQTRAAQSEIKAITAMEKKQWKNEKKKEAQLRMESRAKRRANDKAFGQLEREDSKVERTLGADSISTKSPAQLRTDRHVQEVEWKEDNEASKAQKVAAQVQGMRHSLQIATLERKQAERQWEAMVKSAIGDGALAQQARRDPALVNQNLAQYLTHSSAPSPHVWATAQAEID